MGTKYTGSVVPTLNNAPANAWTTDAEKACHVGELYLVDSNGGGDAGKVYAFSEYGIHEPKNATITDGVAQFSDGGDNLPMSKAEVTLSPSQNGTPWVSTEADTEPYLYRALPNGVGNSELDTLVGGTINWNQLASLSSGDWTLVRMSMTTNGTKIKFAPTSSSSIKNAKTNVINGHKYLVTGIFLADESNYGFQYGIYEADTTNTYDSRKSLTWEQGVNKGIDTIFSVENSNRNFRIQMATTSTTAEYCTIENLQIFDLTAMFGSTIADYINTLETANTGAGVAWFRKLFPAPYYAYDAGTLLSVKTSAKVITGFNLFDKTNVVDSHYINDANGNSVSGGGSAHTDYIRVIPGQAYFIQSEQTSGAWGAWYDADKNYISGITGYVASATAASKTKTAPANAMYMRLTYKYSSSGDKDTFCVNLSDPAKNGTYEAYSAQTYPLDSDLELRGIPKLDASNNLYYDGDTYESDGTVTRKYGIVDLGQLNWVKSTSEFRSDYAFTNMRLPTKQTYSASGWAICTLPILPPNIPGGVSIHTGYTGIAINTDGHLWARDDNFSTTSKDDFKTMMSGVYFVYELIAPTTETADPYTSPQSVSDGGTEEYVDSRAVPMPVGHSTYYANIVPITGETETNITVSDTNGSGGTTYNVTFTDQGTVYGGTYDFVSGTLKVTHANIASYNGETIGTPWLSSYEEYSVGATPTTGAQVVYPLASPQTYSLTAQAINTVLGLNYVWSTKGTLSGVGYQSDNMIMTYGWLETWTMPKITKSNGTVVVLPYPQEYTPEIYDVDAATTGRNAAGTMIRDRVARKHKFNYKWAALSQSELSEILDAIQGESFTLTTADPETGAKTNYTVYPGNRSMPVYWYPTPQSTSWMYQTLSANLIEM